MAPPSNEQVVRRYVEAVVAHDDNVLAPLRHPDWSAEWPQSGERVRGPANDRAIIENWPGGRPTAHANRVVGAEDRWVMTSQHGGPSRAGFWRASPLANW